MATRSHRSYSSAAPRRAPAVICFLLLSFHACRATATASAAGGHDDVYAKTTTTSTTAITTTVTRPLEQHARLSLLMRVNATSTTPPGFPPDIAIARERFKNWSGEIVIDDVWVAHPTSLEQLVAIVNWAAAIPNGPWHVRAVGSRHSWSPIVVTAQDKEHSVLVDLKPSFSRLEMTGPTAVRAGAGAQLGALLDYLHRNGKTLSTIPSLGEITVGGMLAVGAHGTGVVHASGGGEEETPKPSISWGSFSNRVLEMTVVAWNPSTSAYAERVVNRDDPDCGALLVALGRTIITEVVLQVEDDAHLRCQSITSIPGDELFALPAEGAPANNGRDKRRLFSQFMNTYGRVEVTWFPFTDAPWLKVWEAAPRKPMSSRQVSAPYNYAFQQTPSLATSLLKTTLTLVPGLTPMFSRLGLFTVTAGLTLTNTWDIWGASKDLLLYAPASTPRVTAASYAIVTTRDNVQSALHRVAGQWRSLIEAFRQQGKFPMSSPLHIRVTGLDHVMVDNKMHAQQQRPLLAATSTSGGLKAGDGVAVWVTAMTLPGTPGAGEFYQAFEGWIYGTLSKDALCRVEWSKAWAYANNKSYQNTTVLKELIPGSFDVGGQDEEDGDFARASAVLTRLDPRGVFNNIFLKQLFR